ncbi:MAG: GGDEF domain-containing protein [Deltaproteobacteria bacterium]|nr:GGDEF domain-containing protein [Deltaproteobacteria bacterium]
MSKESQEGASQEGTSVFPVIQNSGISLEAERARRFEAQLSVILINVDGLGMVNDTLGREGGDYILSELGELIRQHIRKIDVFGRWDTEDFIVLTVDRNLYGSVALSEKLRRTVSDKVFAWQGNEIRLTVSIGVARGIPKGPKGIDALMMAAGRAVMRAKVAGRNRVEFTDSAYLSTPAQMPAVTKKPRP